MKYLILSLSLGFVAWNSLAADGINTKADPDNCNSCTVATVDLQAANLSPRSVTDQFVLELKDEKGTPIYPQGKHFLPMKPVDCITIKQCHESAAIVVRERGFTPKTVRAEVYRVDQNTLGRIKYYVATIHFDAKYPGHVTMEMPKGTQNIGVVDIKQFGRGSVPVSEEELLHAGARGGTRGGSAD